MKKTALVTGAARGIGRAIALGLGREGYDVAIHYRASEEGARSLQRELEAMGRRAVLCRADLTDGAAAAGAAERAAAALGPISLLVNNAGIAAQRLFQDTDSALWRRMFAVNVDAAYYAIQAVLPAMLHEKAGSIINISSMWGLRAASCEVAYAASKAALIGLTRSLAAELAPSGIRVNCVAPGVIQTDMTRSLGEETLALLREETPLGRLGTPEDVARAVVFLAGEGASFITGQVLTADGGFTL